jgi:hypothetical protein
MNVGKTSLCVSMSMLIAIFGLTQLACAETSSDKTTTKEVKQESQEFIRVLKAYTVEQRDEAIKKAKRTLTELDNRIDKLETHIDKNWDEMDKASREKARASLRELHKKRTQVAEWYGSLKTSSKDAWEHLKEGFSDAYKALHESWEKAENEFGSDKQDE